MSTSQSPEKKKRRPKGSGSLYKRGGIWWMRIGVGGEEDRQSTHQSNWNEAMKVLNALAGHIRRGSVKPSQRKLRTNDLLDILSMDYEVQRRASWKTVEGHIKVLKDALGTRHATEVRYDDLQALALEWQKDGLSNATINRRIAALHRAYVLGRRAGKIAEVPNFPHLKEDNTRQGFVEPADFDRFLYYLPDDGLRDFVDWLGVTGMRRGEAMRLQWSYLQKTPKGYELRIPASDTKNRRARVVPIVADLEPILDRRRKLRRLDCPLIFHRDGKKIWEFRKSWTTAARQTGLEGLTPHDLRRSAIRNLRLSNVDALVAKKISGHLTDSVFQRYNIVTTGDVAEALKRVSKYRKAAAATAKTQQTERPAKGE